jgi:hypothetical protein
VADEEEPKPPLTAAAKKKKQKVVGYAALAVGVVGALIAWLAYRRSQSSSTNTTTTTPATSTPGTSATGTAGTGTVAGYTTDGSQSAYDQEIVQALSALQASLGTPSGETTASEQYAATNFGSEVQSGIGYYFGGNAGNPIVSTGNALYTGFPSLAAAQAYQGTTYYQPTPGVFSAIGAAQAPSGTPLYQQVPSLPAGFSVYDPST